MYCRSMLIAATAAMVTTSALSAQVEISRRGGPQSWLGFSYSNVTIIDNGTRRDFAVILDVVDDSPAQQAGVQVGDTLLSVNGLAATGELLSSLRYSVAPGDVVELRVRRESRDREFEIRAAERPAEYAFLDPRPGVIRIDQDSLRQRIRILMDSTAARIDDMNFGRVVIPDGDRRNWVRIFGDSGSILRSGDRDARLFRNLDGLQVRLDSLFVNWPRESFIRLDSLGPRIMLGSRGSFELDTARFRNWSFITPDSLFRARGFVSGPDSLGFSFFNEAGRSVLRADDDGFIFSGPSGITVLGYRAIGGAQLAEIDEDLGAYFGVDEGVLVMRVPESTPAFRAGLRTGDVIVVADGNDVDSIADIRRAMTARRGDAPVVLEVIRRDQRVTIEMHED